MGVAGVMTSLDVFLLEGKPPAPDKNVRGVFASDVTATQSVGPTQHEKTPSSLLGHKNLASNCSTQRS